MRPDTRLCCPQPPHTQILAHSRCSPKLRRTSRELESFQKTDGMGTRALRMPTRWRKTGEECSDLLCAVLSWVTTRRPQGPGTTL